MKAVVYLSRSRAIVLMLDNQCWAINEVFDNATDGILAFEAWLLSQRRRSLIIVMDEPGDTVDRLTLPATNRWSRWYIVWQLCRHFRQGHYFSNSHRCCDAKGNESLRQYALGQGFTQSAWFQLLLSNCNKVRACYSVSLLAERFMLPVNTATDILLCSSCGDDKIRHSYFKLEQLVFTRVLDKLQSRRQFLQQLSDTREYLQDQRGRVNVAEQNAAPLACCVTTDFPDPRGSNFSPGHVQYSIISRPDVSATQLCAGNLSVSAGKKIDLSVTQARLFDFLTDHLLSWKKTRTLSCYRLFWCRNGVAKQFLTHITSDRLNAFLKKYAPFCIGRSVGLISILLLGTVCGYLWQLMPLRADTSALQRQLQNTMRMLPATDVSPAAMRDVVLLYQSLPEETANPLKILSSIASQVGSSRHIMLNSIEWSADNPTEKDTPDVSLALRNRLSVREESADDGRSILLRLSGYVATDELSISEAYAAYEKFSQGLNTTPEWELVSTERIPFDTSNTAGIANEPGALLEHDGRFSLLLRTTGHFGSAGKV